MPFFYFYRLRGNQGTLDINIFFIILVMLQCFNSMYWVSIKERWKLACKKSTLCVKCKILYRRHCLSHWVQSPAITDYWFLVQKALQQMCLAHLLELWPTKTFPIPFNTVKANSKGGGNPRREMGKKSICGERSCDEGGIWGMWTRKTGKSRTKKWKGKVFGYAHGGPASTESHHVCHRVMSQTWTIIAPYLTHGVKFILLQIFVS